MRRFGGGVHADNQFLRVCREILVQGEFKIDIRQLHIRFPAERGRNGLMALIQDGAFILVVEIILARRAGQLQKFVHLLRMLDDHIILRGGDKADGAAACRHEHQSQN